MKTINVEEMDREEALLLYKGKMYIDGNHQFAFKQALDDEGKELNLDLDSEIDKVANLTHKLSEENKICTLDLYIDDSNNKYLISHFEENMMLNLDLLKKYAYEKDMELGYFKDFDSDDCIILD